VITITGISDHLRLEWPITITGMRRLSRENTAIFRPVDWIKDLAKFDPPDRDLSWPADGETRTRIIHRAG
jgi:hypothetical protein